MIAEAGIDFSHVAEKAVDLPLERGGPRRAHEKSPHFVAREADAGRAPLDEEVRDRVERRRRGLERELEPGDGHRFFMPHSGAAFNQHNCNLIPTPIHAPDYCVDEGATHALALILAGARKLPAAARLTRGGRWEVGPLAPMEAARDLTLGLIGFGRIARRHARMARAIGFQVAAADPNVKKAELGRQGVKPLPLARLLKTADFISLHVPLTPATRHIINDKALRRMKPAAYLINTARGGLVDETALYRAARAGRMAR